MASKGHVSLFCLVKDTRVKQIDTLDFVHDRHRYLFFESAIVLSLFLIRIRQHLHWRNWWYGKLFMVLRSWYNLLSCHIKFYRVCLLNRQLLFLWVVFNLLLFDITLWVEDKSDTGVEIVPELLIRVFPGLDGAFDCGKIDRVLSWQRDIACLRRLFHCIALWCWLVLFIHRLSL